MKRVLMINLCLNKLDSHDLSEISIHHAYWIYNYLSNKFYSKARIDVWNKARTELRTNNQHHTVSLNYNFMISPW